MLAVYNKLPRRLQDLACTVEGARVEWQRYRGPYAALEAEVVARGAWSQDRMQACQAARVRRFVMHAAERVPFYREHFRRHGVDPRSIRRADDLRRVPPITKADVQARPRHFLAEGWPAQDLVAVHTSGTTGAGLKFWASRAAVQEQWAVWWRYRRWHGIYRSRWCDYFGGRPVVPLAATEAPFFRTNAAGRQRIHSGYHLSPAHEAAYVHALETNDGSWIHGYPSMLTLVADAVLRLRGPGGVGARDVTIGAEKLHEHQRRVIESAFSRPVRQHYGLAEAVANISECERGALHVDEDFAVLELGAEGTFGTNLSNFAFPLLRYTMTDGFVSRDEPCGCGHPGRVIASIEGRDEDYVVLPSGARVGRLDHVFKDLDFVAEAQLVQRSDGRVTIRWSGAGETASAAAAIRRAAGAYLGDELRIDLERVAAVPRTAAGKLRFVVREP